MQLKIIYLIEKLKKGNKIPKVRVIIPASGIGKRFGSKTPKQFLKINGKEILALTLEKFNRIKLIEEIIISADRNYFGFINLILSKYNFKKVKKIIEGGTVRQDSVYNALMHLKCGSNDMILVHDAIRPFISERKIIELIKTSGEEKCVILGLPVTETVKIVDKENFVIKTIDRKNLWMIQTPQIFPYGILRKSFDKARKDKFIATDESMIVEHAGYKVSIIEGERKNIKITVREDLNG